MADPGRKARQQDGQRAERLAALFLRAKLYRVLGRNVTTPYGEIDIVARKGRLLVIVEVKHRGDRADPGKVVRYAQRQRVSRAAAYLMDKQLFGTQIDGCRFDLMLIQTGKWPLHWRDAWRP